MLGQSLYLTQQQSGEGGALFALKFSIKINKDLYELIFHCNLYFIHFTVGFSLEIFWRHSTENSEIHVSEIMHLNGFRLGKIRHMWARLMESPHQDNVLYASEHLSYKATAVKAAPVVN